MTLIEFNRGFASTINLNYHDAQVCQVEISDRINFTQRSPLFMIMLKVTFRTDGRDGRMATASAFMPEFAIWVAQEQEIP